MGVAASNTVAAEAVPAAGAHIGAPGAEAQHTGARIVAEAQHTAARVLPLVVVARRPPAEAAVPPSLWPRNPDTPYSAAELPARIAGKSM
jgi:hypothetical protein